MDIDTLARNISSEIIQPLILLLFALALLYFFWGIAKFIGSVGSDEQRKEGRKHMLWGLIGMAIMISVYGIIELIENTLYQGETPPYRESDFPNNTFPN